MEQDEPESRDAYEFPAVDEAIPEPVRTAKDWTSPSARRLLRRHLQGPHSIWIQKLLTLHRLPHITWRLLRHWGATQMVEERVPIKAAQQRLGHSRPDILLKFYAHVLDASADTAAESLSGQLSGGFSAAPAAHRAAV
jgi:integrase